MDGEID